jgi:hypothetical protein
MVEIIEENRPVAFRIVYVFDISQTDGDPIPEQPEWKSPERILELETKLVAFAQAKGMTVTRTDKIWNGSQGSMDTRTGAATILETAGTKTIIHEIAHFLLKHTGGQHAGQELEAEAVAFTVSQHFGLSAPGSPNYIALSSGSGDEIRSRMTLIADTACQIIEAVEAQDKTNQESTND